ncbi:uncharacterized protein LOC143179587 [Calliopsis andreniformis]|uniref:uncharacterized protein LOC143179587 n=1 Tax=Calliopsis andreniformis TaxID=337506 RepID=UPI003FCE1E41
MSFNPITRKHLKEVGQRSTDRFERQRSDGGRGRPWMPVGNRSSAPLHADRACRSRRAACILHLFYSQRARAQVHDLPAHRPKLARRRAFVVGIGHPRRELSLEDVARCVALCRAAPRCAALCRVEPSRIACATVTIAIPPAVLHLCCCSRRWPRERLQIFLAGFVKKDERISVENIFKLVEGRITSVARVLFSRAGSRNSWKLRFRVRSALTTTTRRKS